MSESKYLSCSILGIFIPSIVRPSLLIDDIHSVFAKFIFLPLFVYAFFILLCTSHLPDLLDLGLLCLSSANSRVDADCNAHRCASLIPFFQSVMNEYFD